MSIVFDLKKVPSSLLKEDGGFDMNEAIQLVFKDYEDYREGKPAI